MERSERKRHARARRARVGGLDDLSGPEPERPVGRGRVVDPDRRRRRLRLYGLADGNLRGRGTACRRLAAELSRPASSHAPAGERHLERNPSGRQFRRPGDERRRPFCGVPIIGLEPGAGRHRHGGHLRVRPAVGRGRTSEREQLGTAGRQVQFLAGDQRRRSLRRVRFQRDESGSRRYE